MTYGILFVAVSALSIQLLGFWWTLLIAIVVIIALDCLGMLEGQ